MDAHFRLGLLFVEIRNYQKAKNCYEKVIAINPNHIGALINLGIIYANLGENQKAIGCYKKAIKINPSCAEAYWNLYMIAPNIDEALLMLKKFHKINNNHTEAQIMISGLEAYKGNFHMFNDLLKTTYAGHPHTRSIKWLLSLPTLPKIFFARWDLFNNVIESTNNSRPFYEFGVWEGASFQYLINTFKKGFGFDTFTGLPEAWNSNQEGTFSTSGLIPKIKGGEFIVGKFEDTLPEFFSKEKPLASLINFDADLYSSTLCALNYANKVIDEKTILVFDEFIMSENWEQDEFKALNEFCDNLNISYEVIAVSLVRWQVAIKLKR